VSGVYFNAIGEVDQLIGLSGKAQCGKNYLARHALIPLGYLPIALADHFKVDAVVRDGAPMDEVFFSDKSPATRDLLQRRGTEEGRWVLGEDIWIRTLEAWISAHVSKGWRRFVVTDVRFANEAEWVKMMGGHVAQVVGRGGLGGSLALHPSETGLDDYPAFDAVINNSPDRIGSAVEDLRRFAWSLTAESGGGDRA
jgi:hypothetical protein